MKTKTAQPTDTPAPQPGPWQIFRTNHGYLNGFGIGKDNSQTEIYYVKTFGDALIKLTELVGDDVVLEAVNSHARLVAENKALRKFLEEQHNLYIGLDMGEMDFKHKDSPCDVCEILRPAKEGK